MASQKDEEQQIQIHLITKQSQFSIPDTPYTIQSNVTTVELNNLVNAILKDTQDDLFTEIQFDFLVRGEFLKNTLAKHLKDQEISFEDVIDVEYIERFPAPEILDCLLHDDWVSAIQACGELILTGSYDNSVNLWNMKGEHKLNITGHEAPVKGVGWISMNEENGMALFASGSKDQTIMIWEYSMNKNTVKCIFVCKGHERAVECLAISPNSKFIASGGWDNFLKIWSASTLTDTNPSSSKKMKSEEIDVRTPQTTLEGHREAISSVQWIDNSTILTSSCDHTIKIWDLDMRALKNEIASPKSLFEVNYSALNRMIIAASADKNIRLFDPRSNQGTIVKSTYLGHSQWVSSVKWSKSEEFLFISGSYDNAVKLWDYRSPKAPLFDLIGHEDKVMAVDWSNPKYMLSGGSDNSVRIFKSKKVLEE